ncbi:MAG: diguanylate cyclase [Paracoccus sp. (in: a-proteobacteria)]|nr:diguanylate cyclase [Paracoccus sp. (in: a-proteobacteria)]
MLGRLLVLDVDMAARFAMRARLEAANHQVQTAAGLTEAIRLGPGAAAVLVANPDNAGLARDLTALRRRLRVPVIAVCDAAQRMAAFHAGAEHVLERGCNDAVLRARLRCWLSRPADSCPGMAEATAIFDAPDQIALVTDDAALSLEWRQAVTAATGCRPLVLPPRLIHTALPARLAAVLVDGGRAGAGMQHLADLRARLASEGRGIALALLQRRPLADEEARALDCGADEVLAAALARPAARPELAVRLGLLLRRGSDGERRRLDMRLAQRLALADPLTGLANRRHIDAEIAAVVRAGRAYSLLMIDIDRFKAINDAHGHAAGDTVLRAFAGLLADLAGAAPVARYGGEEFLVLLPDADETQAVSMAERIRHRIAAMPLNAEGLSGPVRLTVSVSVGVAGSEGLPRTGPEEVLRRADAALLAAKGAGRNLVMLSRRPHAA